MKSESKTIFQPGDLLMDMARGRPAVFNGYTPNHPEFVAMVSSRYVRPFELERYKLVKPRAERLFDPSLTRDLIDRPQSLSNSGLSNNSVPPPREPKSKMPQRRSNQKRLEPAPQPITRHRKINLDA